MTILGLSVLKVRRRFTEYALPESAPCKKVIATDQNSFFVIMKSIAVIKYVPEKHINRNFISVIKYACLVHYLRTTSSNKYALG